MTQTYKQIQRQIESLERQAEKLRAQEVGEVVARIKEAIAHYGLTATQLGLGNSAAGARQLPKQRAAVAQASASVSGKGASAKYSDGQGNAWSGRGPRPRWLREALAAGHAIEEFAGTTAPAKRASANKKPAVKRQAKVQYRDQNGNRWSGMGPRPRWLKEALAAGAPLSQFTA